MYSLLTHLNILDLWCDGFCYRLSERNEQKHIVFKNKTSLGYNNNNNQTSGLKRILKINYSNSTFFTIIFFILLNLSFCFFKEFFFSQNVFVSNKKFIIIRTFHWCYCFMIVFRVTFVGDISVMWDFYWRTNCLFIEQIL